MLVAIQSDGNVLCQDNIFTVWVGILLIQFAGIAPFGRAVFLTGAAVLVVRIVERHRQAIAYQHAQNAPRRIRCPPQQVGPSQQ